MRLRTLRSASSLVLCALLGLTSCVPASEWECTRSSECAAGKFCRAGACVPAIGRPGVDGGVQTEADGGPAAAPRCEEGEPPEEGELALNEVLVNVPGGSAGDANGDDIRDAYDDEFVEVVNRTEHTLDLTGVAIANGSASKFRFAATCLQPRQAAVVFGGGMPAERDGAVVRVATSRFAFSNGGGSVAVFSEDGALLSVLTYDASPAEALTLAPQLDGEQYVAHSSLVEERLTSPGTCADGGSFEAGCGESGE